MSVKCRVIGIHRHSTALFEACDLDLWPFGSKINPTSGCINVIVYNKCRDLYSRYNRFWLDAWKDKVTYTVRLHSYTGGWYTRRCPRSSTPLPHWSVVSWTLGTTSWWLRQSLDQLQLFRVAAAAPPLSVMPSFNRSSTLQPAESRPHTAHAPVRRTCIHQPVRSLSVNTSRGHIAIAIALPLNPRPLASWKRPNDAATVRAVA